VDLMRKSIRPVSFVFARELLYAPTQQSEEEIPPPPPPSDMPPPPLLDMLAPQDQGGADLVFAGTELVVTFTEQGPLGLSLRASQGLSGLPEIMFVNAGTQATAHPQLRPGLRLCSVQGAPVAGCSYDHILGMIKAGGRPLSMGFLQDQATVLLEAMLQRLDELDALHTDGIFRQSGTRTEVDSLLNQLGSGGSGAPAAINACLDVHVLASLLRAWLRERSALIPPASIAQLETLGVTPSSIDCARFIDTLPQPGQAQLRAVIGFLQRLDTAATRMTFENVGVVFAPTLLRRDGAEDPMQMALKAKGDAQLIAALLQNLPRVVSFNQPGSLGIRFTQEVGSERVVVMSIVPGSQAESTPVQEGLVIDQVGVRDVTSATYREVIDTLKDHPQRPLVVHFSPGGKLPPQTSAQSAAQPVDHTEQLKGKAAHNALQQEILRAGTKNVGKIERLRRASMQADTPTSDAAAAAMAAVAEEEEDAQKSTGTDCDVVVTFTEPGSLGLTLTPEPPAAAGTVEILKVNPGTQATAHPQLRPGLRLCSVQGVPVAGCSYQHILGMIKAGGRPLSMGFSLGNASASPTPSPRATQPPAGQMQQVTASFRESGPLGLQFVQLKGSERCTIKEIRLGTQASNHSQLRPGMTLDAVGTVDVANMEYKKAIGQIKAHKQRPLDMRFSLPSKSQGSQPAETTENLTGQAAFQALQQEIKKAGTTNVQKIERLRRASMQPDAPAAPGPSNEAAMAAAAAAIDEEGETLLGGYEPEPPQPPPSPMAGGMPLSVTFTPVHGEREPGVKVMKVKPGSQAQQHPSLMPELVLQQVAQTDITQLTYKAVIDEIKRHGERPVTLGFLVPAQLMRPQIDALYARYNPEKLSEVDSLVAKYGEKKLLQMVRKKYSQQQQQQQLQQQQQQQQQQPPPQREAKRALAAPAPAMPALITATFTQAGPLGLQLIPEKGAVHVQGIKPNTQATTHPQLRRGLVLHSVNDVPVAGREYKSGPDSVLSMIKAAGRPVTMAFSDPAAPSTVAGPEPPPSPVASSVPTPAPAPALALAPAPAPRPEPEPEPEPQPLSATASWAPRRRGPAMLDTPPPASEAEAEAEAASQQQADTAAAAPVLPPPSGRPAPSASAGGYSVGAVAAEMEDSGSASEGGSSAGGYTSSDNEAPPQPKQRGRASKIGGGAGGGGMVARMRATSALREWLASSGAPKLVTAEGVIAAFEDAGGFSPEMWVTTLENMKPPQRDAFFQAVAK
jgi:hypothetical protein